MCVGSVGDWGLMSGVDMTRNEAMGSNSIRHHHTDLVGGVVLIIHFPKNLKIRPIRKPIFLLLSLYPYSKPSLGFP